MNKLRAKSKQHKSSKQPVEPPVVELDSMLAPEKMKQMPKLTKGLEHVIFQIKNTNAFS